MAKSTGLGQQFLLSGAALSNDIQGASWGSPHATQDVTGIDVFANERLLGQKTGQMAVVAFFNPAAGRAHQTFAGIVSDEPQADQLATYQIGTVRGSQVANQWGKLTNYDGTRDQAGQLLFNATVQGNGYPVEWGRQLTAGQDLMGAAGAGAGVDGGAATNFGLQAWLHVLLFTGTSATVTLQDFTADTPASYTNITGAAFTVVSAAPAWQRIQTSRTQAVRRWVRYSVTGTFSALLLAVGFERNLTQVDY
jgi:hypothetical protein